MLSSPQKELKFLQSLERKQTVQEDGREGINFSNILSYEVKRCLNVLQEFYETKEGSAGKDEYVYRIYALDEGLTIDVSIRKVSNGKEFLSVESRKTNVKEITKKREKI